MAHRRFQTWCCNEILRLVLTDVANELRVLRVAANYARSVIGRHRFARSPLTPLNIHFRAPCEVRSVLSEECVAN